MNSVISNDPLLAPHLLTDPRLSALHQDQQPAMTASTRKRKASEEPDNDRMSTSPMNSPAASSSRALPSTHRSIKRTRTHISGGRPLPLPRLLQTLSIDEMRGLLQSICDEDPQVKHEVVSRAPRPSINSVLSVLATYEQDFQKAFPFGVQPTSDYTFNRVRQQLTNLLDALRDFTPYYLPPQETQATHSLTYLDAATNVLHNIPEWDDYLYRRHKFEAYDEIAKAWLLVLREAQKSAGVFRLQGGGWEQKLVEHNQKSGGRFDAVIEELRKALGFMHSAPSNSAAMNERINIRQQLMSGSYGQQLGVGHGQW